MSADKGRHPTVTTVMVTYNSAELVLRRDGAVPQAPWITTVVVDNASADGTADAVASVYPDARLIRNPENTGFSRAVNLGAQGVDTDFLLLLNPDAAIDAAQLEALARHLAADRGAAVTAPFVQDGGAEFATIAAGYAPTAAKMFLHATGLSRLGRRIPPLRGHYLFARDVPRRGRLDVDWVSGGCMLIRTDVWRALGGLTERWFMYAEDIELCLRVREAGYRVTLDAETRARHEIGQSSSGLDGRANPAWILNLYELYRWRLARSRGASLGWKLAVLAGFAARVGSYRAIAAARGMTPRRAANIRRFRVYARALLRAPSRLIRD